MIELIEITKQYESIKAVDSLSIKVEPGRIFGFLGPNGAGKTTSIRMLMNIIQPDMGKILFSGNSERPAAHFIGYLPEERGLYQKISVRETLQYFAHLRNVKHADEKINRYLDKFSLSDRAQAKVSELSKGNQQKLQFINTILHDPQFVVLDEPFSGLDPVNQLLLKDILEGMKAEGKTIIFSSHQIDQVEKICDDVALINQGRLVLSGSLSEVKKNHGDTRLEITPEGDHNLTHEFFKNYGADIRDGSAYLQSGSYNKQEIIAQANGLFDLRSIRMVEPGLEEIFIQLVQGDPK